MRYCSYAAMRFGAATAALVALALAQIIAGEDHSYRPTADCEVRIENGIYSMGKILKACNSINLQDFFSFCAQSSRVCGYTYYAKQSNFDGEQQQSNDISAEVRVWCSSGETRLCGRAHVFANS